MMSYYNCSSPSETDPLLVTESPRKPVALCFSTLFNRLKKYTCPILFDDSKLDEKEYKKTVLVRRYSYCVCMILATSLLVSIFLCVLFSTIDRDHPNQVTLKLTAFGGPVVLLMYICSASFVFEKKRASQRREIQNLDHDFTPEPNAFACSRTYSNRVHPEDNLGGARFHTPSEMLISQFPGFVSMNLNPEHPGISGIKSS